MEAIELFRQCRMSLETGILPKEGSFTDQDYSFIETFPEFIERWKARNYGMIWKDVQEFTEAVLKSIFGKGKK